MAQAKGSRNPCDSRKFLQHFDAPSRAMSGRIASAVRPLKGMVKPASLPAKSPLLTPAGSLIAAPKAPAVQHETYPWGVKWTGHPTTDQPDINWAEMNKAWSLFRADCTGFRVNMFRLWKNGILSVVASRL